jgi:hypothetical protein
MRIRSVLALASASFFAAGFGIPACGGSSDDAAEVAQDSGVVEAAADAAKEDATVDAADAALLCDPKKDFFAAIPDASIDDGGSTTGICVGCVKASCATEVGKCGADCVCQNVAASALTDTGDGGRKTSSLGPRPNRDERGGGAPALSRLYVRSAGAREGVRSSAPRQRGAVWSARRFGRSQRRASASLACASVRTMSP